MQQLQIGRVYRHFKGDYYLVEALARDSETGEPCVIYRKLYGDGGLWVRSPCFQAGLTGRNTPTLNRSTASSFRTSQAPPGIDKNRIWRRDGQESSAPTEFVRTPNRFIKTDFLSKPTDWRSLLCQAVFCLDPVQLFQHRLCAEPEEDERGDRAHQIDRNAGDVIAQNDLPTDRFRPHER